LETRREIELLRCCAALALSPEREARARELLREGVEWDALRAAAKSHGLTPLLFRHLSGTLADEVSAEQLERLREVYRQNAVRNLFMTGELSRLLGLFERAGVAALAYKGPALALDAYGDLTLRQFGDLDLLIRRRDLGRVTALLAAEGYEAEFELSGVREAAFQKWWYVQPFRHAGSGIYLEIHWAVAPRFFSFALETEDLLTRSRTLGLGDGEARVPSVQDTLLLLCVHGAKDTWARLEWVAAVAEFVRRHTEIDWRESLRQAQGLGAERILLLGLKLARELSEVELPDFVVERIESSSSLRSLSARVAGELSQGEKSFQSFFGRASFHLRSRERVADRARYCLRAATATSPSEWDLFPLPGRLFFLYSLVRPLRFAKGLLSEGTARRDG
jgi:hypothetical protein